MLVSRGKLIRVGQLLLSLLSFVLLFHSFSYSSWCYRRLKRLIWAWEGSHPSIDLASGHQPFTHIHSCWSNESFYFCERLAFLMDRNQSTPCILCLIARKNLLALLFACICFTLNCSVCLLCQPRNLDFAFFQLSIFTYLLHFICKRFLFKCKFVFPRCWSRNLSRHKPLATFRPSTAKYSAPLLWYVIVMFSFYWLKI